MDCPCCKQKLPAADTSLRLHQPLGVVVRGEQFVNITQAQMTILLAAHKQRPDPVPIEKILHELYGHRPDGGPENPLVVIRTQVTLMNRRLKKLRVCLSGDGVGRRGNGYLLIEQAL